MRRCSDEGQGRKNLFIPCPLSYTRGLVNNAIHQLLAHTALHSFVSQTNLLRCSHSVKCFTEKSLEGLIHARSQDFSGLLFFSL
jgi:hypothetical protein